MKSVRSLLLLVFCLLPVLTHGQLYEQSVRQIIDAIAADSLVKAEGMIRETLLLDPSRKSNAVLYQYLGEIYQLQGKNDKALEAYGSGIKLSQTVSLLLSRASLYMQTSNMERALSDYNQVLEIEEDNEESLFFRAYIYSQQRRNKEARADYSHLLKLNPKHEDGRLGLAILNSKDGRPREAMEQLDALILLYPTHARHYLTRCGLYEQRKEYENALKDVEKAIELEPENHDCYLTRASLYLSMKKKRLAREDSQTAIRLGASMEQVAPLLSRSR